MGDARRRTCRTCRKTSDVVGSISWNGNCLPCAQRLERENIEGLASHSGPAFTRWRHGMAASVGAVLLDDGRAAP